MSVMDELNAPKVRALAARPEVALTFDMEAPPTMLSWYAAWPRSR